MYRLVRGNRRCSNALRGVRELFALFIEEPQCLPTNWRARAGGPGSELTACLVSDYIAGMTDRYAIEEHARLFDLSTPT